MKPTPAPYIKARRAPRPHALMGLEVRRIQMDGDIWLVNRHGIVVYVNELLPLGHPERLKLIPRDARMEIVPGFFAPPAEFALGGHPGCWIPIDWIRDPKHLKGDPRVARILFLRQLFFHLKRGHQSARWRAYDIWPQVHTGQGPLWPMENRAVLPEG